MDLREQIVLIISNSLIKHYRAFADIADDIIALLKEAGWKSPEGKMDDKEIELQALITIREGYVAENKQREKTGDSMAYSYEHFFELAEQIRNLKLKE